MSVNLEENRFSVFIFYNILLSDAIMGEKEEFKDKKEKG